MQDAMTGTVDRATLDRLIALGRARGGLTAADLQDALPVDVLDVEALVLIMLELDAAGVSVEPDAFGPRAEPGAPGIRLPVPNPGAPAPTEGGGARGPSTEAPPSPVGARAVRGGPAGEEPIGRVVLLAGLAVLLILGTLLIVL